MRKIVMLNQISLDGFFAGPNGEMDWFSHDAEVGKAAHEMMKPDTLLLGRVTYEIFFNYWPSIAHDLNASENDRTLSKELNEMTKIVFSKSLKVVTWENSKLVSDDPVDVVRELKQSSGADITIFGSGSIVQRLTNSGLIDEFLVHIAPVVLGAGK